MTVSLFKPRMKWKKIAIYVLLACVLLIGGHYYVELNDHGNGTDHRMVVSNIVHGAHRRHFPVFPVEPRDSGKHLRGKRNARQTEKPRKHHKKAKHPAAVNQLFGKKVAPLGPPGLKIGSSPGPKGRSNRTEPCGGYRRMPCESKDRGDFRLLVLTGADMRTLQACFNNLQKLIVPPSIKVIVDVVVFESTHTLIKDNTAYKKFSSQWHYGAVHVHEYSKHMGRLYSTLSAWRPAPGNHKELGIFIDARHDVTTKLLVYLRILQGLLSREKSVLGYYLSDHPALVAEGSKKGNRLMLPAKHSVFMYPFIGTGVFAVKPSQWRHFQNWYFSLKRNNKLVSMETSLRKVLSTQPQHSHLSKDRTLSLDALLDYFQLTRVGKQTRYSVIYPNVRDKYLSTRRAKPHALLTHWKAGMFSVLDPKRVLRVKPNGH